MADQLTAEDEEKRRNFEAAMDQEPIATRGLTV